MFTPRSPQLLPPGTLDSVSHNPLSQLSHKCRLVAQPLAQKQHPILRYELRYGGTDYALDHFRDPAYSVADRGCDQLYVGRIHSHSAGAGSDRADLPAAVGAQSGLKQSRRNPGEGSRMTTAGGSGLRPLLSFCGSEGGPVTSIPMEEAMNEDKLKGKAKDIAGRVQRQAGEWSGNTEQQVKGAMKQGEGKLQNAVGQAEDAMKDARDREQQREAERRKAEEERARRDSEAA